MTMWKRLVLAALGCVLAGAAVAQAPAVVPYDKADTFSVAAFRGDVGEARLPFALLPARAKLAYVEPGGRLVVFDLHAETRTELSHPLPVQPMVLIGSPDGRQLMLVAEVPGSGGQIVTLDVDSGAVRTRLQLPDGARFGRLMISRATGHVAVLTAQPPRRLMLFDGVKGALIFDVDARSANFVTFRADGQQLVTSGSRASGRQGLIEFWNATTGARERQLVLNPSTPMAPTGQLAMSPDGRLLVVQQRLPEGEGTPNPAADGASALLVRAEDGTPVGELKGHSGPLVSLQFSPDGAFILTGSADRQVRLWSGRDGTPVSILDGHPRLDRPIRIGDVVGAQFAPQPLHPIWPFGPDTIISSTGSGEFVLWEKTEHRVQRLADDLVRAHERALQGDYEAMSRVFVAYDQGQGVRRDLAKADLWLRRRAGEPNRSSQLVLATRLVRATGASQDCGEAGQWLRKAQSLPERTGADERFEQHVTRELARLRHEVLAPAGGTEAAAALAPSIVADLLEAQMLDALTRQDHAAFLANLCAFEFLGHADTLPATARHELLYHRAVALRAAGKPLPALTALQAYLAQAGRAGTNYPAALQLLRPLQTEASP